ncbi:MAG: bifunctional diaminohydroxyphosphoribosylaminopyrimidine deaminase/5-amino-6-(5-phosphoribosylamino)uracil reductase RibD [Gammaproteobacteria bacterium]|nr:bifunctional diaminohydroxyphosphoribosylaminopyrimidine deaminase/5-amino-6-(5-phosphoribosylamino)uracil reductase RibD [Gammaproteobacteria bacterium]MYF60329.1 bifunctional diaminohydroxyphosphoribosylaminopyrimidine deaminase/5-amino-6-(5-phosphoribosylamino)uracil reductase RibD [Gammaproteobacteria bacterium]MYI23486.1 bifunctional diaminohydroxyphosphoribosylaminopyrimidine deaminase/5-amino-6-(5-phosphoribosylamino)uracil reductase RibD [Gammaproteobacteria bacterium]
MTESGTGGLDLAPNDRVSKEDLGFLDRAIELGRRGWGRVSPNPMVGCVVVQKGEVVGEGWHRELGGPHAEVHALAEAGESARGATAYTSLEPCAHTGRTPPCTGALLDAGITRVVFAAADPGAGAGGAAVLRAGGIRVDGPAFSSARAASQNPAFFHVARNASPYVALKLALSLDGRISRAGEQTGLTGPLARQHVHYLRAGFDAIMVGANTMKIDDPRLTARGRPKPRRAPDRIVLDSRARMAPEARLLRDDGGGQVRIYTGADAPVDRVRALQQRGATVHAVPRSARGLDLGAVLDICYRAGLTSILCEGGGVLSSSLLREGRLQRLYLFLAPLTLGPGSVPAFPGLDEAAWEGWRPAGPPAAFGRDLLWILDRGG